RRDWRRGPLRKRFAMSQRDIAECRTTSADLGFAVRIEREKPGITIVAESFVGDFEYGHETFIEERVVEPAVYQAAGGTIAESRQPDLPTVRAISLQREGHAQIAIDDFLQRCAAFRRDELVKIGSVVMKSGLGKGEHAVDVVVERVNRRFGPELFVADHGIH